MNFKTGLYTHRDCLKHTPGDTHPESPVRLQTVLARMEETFPRSSDPDHTKYAWNTAPLGTEHQVLLAHTAAHWDALQNLNAQISTTTPHVNADEDTIMSAGSLNAALYGIGGVCRGVDDVLAGTYKNAFIMTRPPGHHAEKDRVMGFCLFGTIAIAAKYALTKPEINKVAIVDFDVHHGNGTEDIVQDDSNVLFFSMHQEDIWPYQHHEDQGPHGTINNMGFGKRCDPALWHQAFDNIIAPKINDFAPDLILISAGFDAHRDDPPAEQLFNDPPGQQNLVEDDFNALTRKIMALADTHCAGRVVSLLEGGYNPDVLASCAVQHAKMLMGS